MGATKQRQIEEMENDFSSAWVMLGQLQEEFVDHMLEETPSDVTDEECARLSDIKDIGSIEELTDEDKKLLVKCFAQIEAASHYQDVATKDD
jgi:hypothetical protein